jgi:hypothetical protein
MVLVSIRPFAIRKIFLLAVAVLGLSSALCFADPLFMTRQYAFAGEQTEASLKRCPLMWRSFDRSSERFDGTSTMAFRALSREGSLKTDFVPATRIVGGYQRPAVCWRPGTGSSSPLPAFGASG